MTHLAHVLAHAVAAVAVPTLAGPSALAAPTMPQAAISQAAISRAATPKVAMPAALAAAMPAPAFRHVVANGTTKPPGAALDARGGLTPALASRERAIHDLVATAICRGC